MFNTMIVKLAAEFAFQKVASFCLIEETSEDFVLITVAESNSGLQICSITGRKSKKSEG